MGTAGKVRASLVDRARRRRIRTEQIETGLIIALAGLVLFKGAPAIAGLALAFGQMMAELLRVLIAA